MRTVTVTIPRVSSLCLEAFARLAMMLYKTPCGARNDCKDRAILPGKNLSCEKAPVLGLGDQWHRVTKGLRAAVRAPRCRSGLRLGIGGGSGRR